MTATSRCPWMLGDRRCGREPHADDKHESEDVRWTTTDSRRQWAPKPTGLCSACGRKARCVGCGGSTAALDLRGEQGPSQGPGDLADLLEAATRRYGGQRR